MKQTATHLELDPATGKYKLYTDRLSSIEGVSVAAGNSVIFGDHKSNELSGGVGTDIIQGRGGDDLLDAGDDLVFDSLDGGDGDDRLAGGVLDHLRGGDGNDRIGIDGASALIAGGEGVDTLIVAPDVTIAFGSDDAIYGIEKVVISRGASVDFSRIETSRGLDLVSRSAADHAVGIAGTRHADTFRAGNGIDIFDGEAGIDTVSYAGSADSVVLNLAAETGRQGAHEDTLRHIENATGTDQDDVLIGNDASNVLKGGAGNDRLYGSARDELRGGSGNDVLVADGASKLIDGGAGADALVVQPAGRGI